MRNQTIMKQRLLQERTSEKELSLNNGRRGRGSGRGGEWREGGRNYSSSISFSSSSTSRSEKIVKEVEEEIKKTEIWMKMEKKGKQ